MVIHAFACIKVIFYQLPIAIDIQMKVLDTLGIPHASLVTLYVKGKMN
jgi:hypothetical protein